MHLLGFFVLALLLISTRSFGQLPLPEDLNRTVAFLFPTDGIKVGAGTGFYVTTREGTQRSGYLVTARHVLMADSKQYYPRLCMKVNNNSGGSDVWPVDLSGPNAARIFVHPTDSNVDIAVIPGEDIPIPLPRRAKDYDFEMFSVSLFATKEHFDKRYIQLGDEAFLTGWFSSFFGAVQNYPIARFGRLAMAPDEKIPWRDGRSNTVQMLNLYLVESHVTAGNSGSPVFFRPNLQREPGAFVIGRQTLFLAGVLKGYFNALDGTNSGIAAVVPAFQLREILLSEEIRQYRSKARKPKPPGTKAVEACTQAEKQIRQRLGQP
jgi:hypothetical protein